MKKSKVFLAVALAVVLLITIISSPTFSWFIRPKPEELHPDQSGDVLQLVTKNSYGAYNGNNVSIVTKRSDSGSHDPIDTYTTTCSDSTSLSGSGIGSTQRKYFCTTITNNNNSVQNVSLYAKTLTIPTSSNGTLALGVNEPTRSYRDYTSLATQTSFATHDSMRIYFQKSKNNPPNGWNGENFYICWNEDPNTGVESLNSTGSNGTYYKMNYCGESNGYYNYFSDIPKTATHAFFACENWGTNNNGQPNYAQRTQTLWNLSGDGQSQLQSKIYQLTSTVTNGNTTVHTPPYSVVGACINNYYDTIFVTTGSTYNANLGNTTNIPTRSGYSANFIGTLRFYSGDQSVFTVDEISGVITPVGAGEAKLYTKARGGFYTDNDQQDAQQVETTIKVTVAANYVFKDVPIVRNIQIPGSSSGNNVVKVYWYVINNSKTTPLTYFIDEVYLGL